MPHDVGGPRRRPVPSAQPVPVPGRQRLEGPRPEVRAPGLARRGRRRSGGDALIRDAWPTVERSCGGLAATRSRRRRAARARRPARPDVRHVADARAVGLRRARCGWPRSRRPRRWPGGSATTRRPTRWAGWFERGQVAFDVRLWRERPLRLRRRRRRRAPTASWPTSSPASGTRTRPGLGDLVPPERVDAALRTIHAPQRRRLRRRADGRRQRDAPGRHGRHLERAVGGGLGRDDLRARGVHARRGLDDEGWADGAGRGGGHLRARTVVPDARGVRRTRQLPGAIYLRPLAIWAIEEALGRRARASTGVATAPSLAPGRSPTSPPAQASR